MIRSLKNKILPYYARGETSFLGFFTFCSRGVNNFLGIFGVVNGKKTEKSIPHGIKVCS